MCHSPVFKGGSELLWCKDLTLGYAHNSVFELNGSKVVMDEPSLELLNGSKLDYTMELIGSQFKIVDNPYATSSCGQVFLLSW